MGRLDEAPGERNTPVPAAPLSVIGESRTATADFAPAVAPGNLSTRGAVARSPMRAITNGTRHRPVEQRFYCDDCSRCAKPLARTARRPIAARTEASDPTTRTFRFARVTAVYNNSRVNSRESCGGNSTVTSSA